jgi:hypothetical protein
MRIILSAAIIGTVSAAYERPLKFIVASSPGTSNVYWAPLPSFQDLTLPTEERTLPAAEILIDGAASKCTSFICDENSDKGLVTPEGLALYQPGGGTGSLYVSDTEPGHIYRYQVHVKWGGRLAAGSQELIADNLKGEARYLSVDGYGNLFYTLYEAGKIRMISADALNGNAPLKSKTLYAKKTFSAVAGPAGIAVDNMNIFWANLQGDAKSGTVVKASASKVQQPTGVTVTDAMYKALARDVCLAKDVIFITGETNTLFAVKTTGGDLVEISQKFNEPRGCVYDQEATLYVAQKDGIRSLPANYRQLRASRYVDEVVKMPDPTQIAIFFGPSTGLSTHSG